MATPMRTSKNFHNTAAIANDLTASLPSDLPRNGVAFLICDSHVDSEALLPLVGERIPYPVVGGTTFTYPLAENTDEISAVLTILAKDSLSYSIAVTPELDETASQQQMTDCYQQCLAGLDGAPKMLMPFFPRVTGLTTDLFINQLFALADGVPVFGGVTTDDLDSTEAAVYADGQVYYKNMVLLALGGDIRPVFSVGSQLTILAEYGPAVTQSEQNIVRRVDDMTFCEYMRSIGIPPEQRENGVDALVQYGPLPCRLRHKLEDDDGIPEIRCISYTNAEDGSAAFSSALPVGTKVNIGIIQKNDVVESSQQCLSSLKEKMQAEEAKGYCYSTLFSVPCVARYFAMLGGKNLEQSLMSKELSKDLAVSTYYGFCEIGPTQGSNGTFHNRSHNASVVMCAL